MKSGQGFNQSGGDRTRPPADPRTLEEIQRRTPQVAGRVEVTRMPAGTIITPLGARPSPGFTLPYHPLAIKPGIGTNTNAVLEPGYVVVRHIEEGLADGLNLYETNIGNLSMWADPIPELQLAGNVSYNYLHTNTNELGEPTQNWEVISSATEKNSTHHIPPDPEGVNGTNGEYYIEVFRTNIGNSASNYLELKWGGHYIWTADMWAGIHPSAASYDTSNAGRPYARFNENANRHEFRIHVSNHGHNVSEVSDTIDHFFYGRNIGTGSSNIANVYTGNTSTRAAEFNIIKERDTNPQVSVAQADNESPIQISGNNKDLTLSFQDCNGNSIASISFVDGLVTTSGTVTITVPACSNA